MVFLIVRDSIFAGFSIFRFEFSSAFLFAIDYYCFAMCGLKIEVFTCVALCLTLDFGRYAVSFDLHAVVSL